MKKKRLVEITLWGVLGNQMGKKAWKLAVKSVAEACHAINVMTGSKLYHQLIENDKKNCVLLVLIMLFIPNPPVYNTLYRLFFQ